MKTSRISGFYKLPVKKRLQKIKELAELSDEEMHLLIEDGKISLGLDLETADRMIENVLGVFELPFGVALNFMINDKDYIIPMAIEETSVVAAASNAAKIAREKGGFTAKCSESHMIGQIQVVRLNDEKAADKATALLEQKEKLLQLANMQDKVLVDHGGGAKDIEVRILDCPEGKMLVMHLIVDVKDAMGANAVNSMCEALAPIVEDITKGDVRLRIISNLADRRVATAQTIFDKDKVGGEEVVDRIIEAYQLAAVDPYRAATHNKGIMNGVDAVVIATGNDFRAIESGAHAYAARNGRYEPLTSYWKNKDGDLVGKIEIPVAVGTIGGVANVHPKARLSRKIMGVKTAKELGEVIASLGLAQNFAALRALATEGIQKGHMSLHAKNIAVMAGAKKDEIDRVAEKMVEQKNIKIDAAKEILDEIRGKN